MNAQALADLLRQQSAQSPHEIRLNDLTLGTSGLDALVERNLVRPDGTIVLVVDPSTIPQQPPSSGFTLAANVPTGADAFLSLDGRNAQIQFIVGASSIDLVLTVWTRQTGKSSAPWVFSQSFPELSDEPYDDLTLASPALVFSTGASGQPAAGLSFDGQLTLDGIFKTIANLLGVSDDYPLTGALTRGGDGFGFDLQAQIGATKRLGSGTVNITIEKTYAGVALTPLVTDGNSTVVTSLYLGASLNFQTSKSGQLPLQIQVQLPLNSKAAQVLVLSVIPFIGAPVAIAAAPGGASRSGGTTTITTTAPHGLAANDYATIAFIEDDSFNGTFPVASVPDPTHFTYTQTNTPDAKSGGGTVASGIQTSLAQLGALVGGAAWDDFFDGPAAPLKSYFETFGLLGFTTTFMPSTASVSSITLSVGTLQPWTMWDGYTVTLAATWNILFLGGSTVQTLDLKADFNFKTINFLLDIQLPQLLITGRQTGAPITYSLDQLNSELFDGKLAIPPDLLTVSVADFNISISVPNKQFYVGATASASVALFGTPLLGIHDMAIGVTVDASGAQTLYTATLDGQISLGPIYFQTDATITNDPKADTVLSMHLVDETVGSMLNHLVHLVDPTYDISLPDPWGKLLDIKLDALVLKITLPGAESKTQRSVALTYDAEIDLGFIKLTSISLVYLTQAAAGSNVTVALSGSFFGQQFGTGGDSANPPLAWDAMNGSPPSVPGQGSSLFDLQYVGLGQHVAFQGVELTTVEQVMKALRQSVLPSPSGQLPPFGQNGLAFSQQSNWLIGAQFSIMGTLAISAIFNDPNLYGILITLSGEKAKIFAGLSFEILYRKVTETIGVYHIELKLPDAMRNLQFGEVSITLPVIIVDIYTNGNFRVNLGFPVGLDFSNSFSLQVFPFIGYGGFYFALLDGATSTRVPQITNGTFSPVIEFGVALSIGVGKTVNEGILSGGISVTVVGILQGCLAWFQPTDGSSKEMYYWFQGSISIVGRLYATINFAIIQASLDVTAYATVTLTIESHKPIYIAISAGVSVRVSVKIVFFTIHLSFRATINASFTIGSASPTPWQLAPGGGATKAVAAPDATALAAYPQLRGQQTLYSASPLHSHASYNRALRRAMLEAAPPEYLTSWPAVCVLPQGKQTVIVWATSAFTKSEAWTIAPGGAARSAGTVTITTTAPHDLDAGDAATVAGVADSSFGGTFTVATVPSRTQFTYAQQGQNASSGGGTATAGRAAGGADAIILLAAENSVDPGAVTLNEHRALFGAAPESVPFNLLMQALLGWGVYVETGGGAAVTADQLSDLHWQLQQAETVAAAFDYATLTAFLAANFTFDVQAEPEGVTGVALFPMFPAVTVTDTSGTNVNFGGFDSVDPTYQEKVQAYFRLLQVQYESRDTSGGGDGGANEDVLASAQAESMATVLFSQYFNMLMSAGAKAAVDLLAAYPYTPQAAMSIADIGEAVGDPTLVTEPSRVVSPNQELNALNPGAVFSLPGVVHQIKAGETFATVASDFNSQGALNSQGAPYALADLLAANNSTAGIYNVGTSVAFSGLTYTTQPNDTLNLVAARLLLRAYGAPLLSPITGLAATADALRQQNPLVANVNQTLAVSIAPASAAGAVRAGGTVTVTTTAPHGLATGAGVTISGVTDSSFNGTFTVASVAGPAQFTYAQAGTDSASGEGAAGLALVTVAATIAPADGAAARASGVITFTTTAAHNFAQGDLVSVYGVADNTFDGQFTIVSVPTAESFTVSQTGQPDAKSGGGYAGIPAITSAQGATYSVVAGDTLTLIAAYFLAAQQGVGDPATYVASLLQLNSGLPVSDPTAPQPAGTQLKLPPVTRAVAVGDTIYSMATTLNTTAAVVQNTLTSLPTKTVLLAPQGVLNVPLRYAVAAGDTFSGIAAKFNLTLDDVTNQALAVEGLFAPQTWQVASGGGAVRASGTTTLTTTAAHGLASGNSVLVGGVADDSFDGTFTVASVPSATTFTFFQASQPDATSGGGTVSRPITVNDLPSINVQQMMSDLTHQAEWNNASAMVSRFLLSGLRLPDPNDPYFQSLSVEDLLDPTKLAAVRTKPLFKLTGQQYSLPSSLGDYQITLTNSAGAGWLQLGSSGSLTFGLTAEQQNLMELIATTPLAPGVQTLARLALFQMLPPRIALQNHITWQAAVRPSGCLSSSAATGNPSVWLFPDSLVEQLDSAAAAQQQAQTGAPLLYELVVAKHHAPDQPVVAAQADCYAWATIVDFTVSLPVADGDAPSLSNVYIVGGADDTGAALLQQLYNYLAEPANNASATLYLLYSPNPTSANPSGLSSDQLNATSTYILKTNLSTLTHSGAQTLFESFDEESGETVTAPKAVPDPTSVYAAPVSDAPDFIALLWEASITRSGGFYLNYVNQNGGAALPASVFGSSSTATLSLLVLLDSQTETRDAAIMPTNNCVVVGDNLDTSTSSVFVQPATYTVQPNDCLSSALAAFNADWATSYTLAQLASWNQGIPLLLQVGAPLATPSGGKPYIVQYGDTLAGLITKNVFPDLNTLLNAGSNAASAILAPGSQLTIPGYSQNPYTVEYGDTLAGLVAAFGVSGLDALLGAGANSTSPILVTGAPLALPNTSSLYTIAAGDTLSGIVQKLSLPSLDALMAAGNNSTSAVLAAGAQMQMAEGVLAPSTIVPPGTVGFEMTRTNPDPDNLPLDDLQPAQVVSSLFNLIGFSIAQEGAFTASGEGLPTSPADSEQAQADGLTPRDLGDSNDPNWFYQQTLSVAPFGGPQHGSASAALPAAQSNPYNGVGGEVTLELNLQDTYGNAQPLPAPYDSIGIPVGYFDAIANLGSWPSLAVSYEVSGQPPVLSLRMTMQQARYVPSPSVDVTSALAAVSADLATYTGIYYQLAQPDYSLTLRTTLDDASTKAGSPGYQLPKTPFFAFAYGAYVYLAALNTMQAVELDVTGGTTSVQGVTTQYGVTAPQLFAANQNQLYSSLFGSAALVVPQMYATVSGDSLSSIAAKWPSYNLTAAKLAALNSSVPLNPGADFQATQRTASAAPTVAAIASESASGAARKGGVTTVTTTAAHGLVANDYVVVAGVADSSFDGEFTVVSVPDTKTLTYAQGSAPDATSGGGTTSTLTPSLGKMAQDAHASAAAVAGANAQRTDILRQGAVLTVGAKSYTLGANDYLENAAAKLGSTVAEVAAANQWLQGIFLPAASLTVTDVLAEAGDTLLTLANNFAGGDLDTFAANNAAVSDLFESGTAVQVGTNQNPLPPAADDTLTTFAAANKVTVDELASANATNTAALFASGAKLSIPGALTNTSQQQFSTYTAASSGETLADIAQKFGKQPADILALNADIPGLLAPKQPVKDTASGKTVTTAAGDTFDSVIARFQQQFGVTVSAAQLASDVAAQTSFVVPSSLWLGPPMLGGVGGLNNSLSLSGLAAQYNTDVGTLAAANAAAIGFLAPNQTLPGWDITTNEYETLNSVVNRLNGQGMTLGGSPANVSSVASALADLPNLVNPQASVVPVPPPSPAGNAVTLTPKFASPVFQILVQIISTRDASLVDPDFTGVSSVSTSTYAVAPEPDQNSDPTSSFTLTQFASALQASMPGLQVATGDPVAEGDPASASTIWAVNFGSTYGTPITFKFEGAQTQYFALPPLSTSLMGGSVQIIPYVSGQNPPFTGQAQAQTFQAIDLDTWLNTFLQAVDTFLSPAYSVPAYAVDPADGVKTTKAVVEVVEQKQILANVLSQRLQYVLQDQQEAGGGSGSDAVAAIYQAMLTQLTSAFTVNTLVQVPVTVSNPGAADTLSAPRLSGKVLFGDPGGEADANLPNDFSFSTAKVSLTDSGAPSTPNATFLFSVKAPASHKEASLNLQYVVTEMELPDPSSVIGSYEGSSWLKFILPLDDADTYIGDVSIPIPLRAYPSPVTLVSQTARQAADSPQNASSLLGWDFDFVYQHDDAEQDTPLVAVSFNAAGPPQVSGSSGGVNLSNVFQALAQFMAVYPALKPDLDQLTQLVPGSPTDTALAAVEAFAYCVKGVADAFTSSALADFFVPTPVTYFYQLQKNQSGTVDPNLTTLTITSIDPETGAPQQNPTVLWPAVVAQYGGSLRPLTPASQTADSAVYNYPAGIPAGAQFLQYFLFGVWAVAGDGGAARASGTTTITTESPHGLSAGDTVSVSGVTDPTFDGTFTVASVPDPQTLTYAQAGADSASGGGSISVLGAALTASIAAGGGAARAGGETTITTTAPHGFDAGDAVTVAGVTDASFDGTFTIDSVPSPTQLTYAQAGASDASSGGGTVQWAPPPAANTLTAPQLFSFRLSGDGLNVLAQQSGRAGVSITRNLSLVGEGVTNGAFVYQTPLTSFTTNATPSVFAANEIVVGSAPTAIAEALGGFLQTLFTSQNQWKQGQDTLTIRLAAGYSYALATSPSNASALPELNAVVPILLVPSQSFDPTSDWQWPGYNSAPNAGTFVSQVQAAIAYWQGINSPSTESGSYIFDLTVYASEGQLQPLIHATNLQYRLAANESGGGD